ncbi:hypothetical protein [Lutimaribacter saemankumensis]|uniref:Uncharacterized protein n=1 Tax=Lutimaribacter saemankumensis TaxID=490829 RepID=A0A1G8SEG2_9RHOB|nr:hypothetical protein [Lutimaribacter saemankumensis]SDJ27626.1 hypothetical protein SAMN05421850_11151 [Lutimaribacter saemankumensis]
MKTFVKPLAAASFVVSGLLASAAGAETAPPPPYLMTGANTVTIAVTWDAASLDGLLPDGVEPADDLSGGLNVYDAEGGFGLTPYSAAYAYINVKGFDSAIGAPARYIIGGWYGPDPKVAAAMNTHFNAGVGTGDANQSGSGDTWTGTGGDGTGSITIVIKPGSECGPAAGTLNYVGTTGEAGLKIPFTGSFCGGEAVSVDIQGAEGSALAQVKVDQILGGGRLLDGIFTFAD